MPAEWAPHERTLMAWPCRARAVGRPARPAPRREYAARRATRSPRSSRVTMVVRPPRDAAEARARAAGERRGRRAADRRLVAARQRPDLRRRRRRRARRRALRLQRLGREVHALGRRRRDRRPRCVEHLGARALRARRWCSRAARSPSTATGTLVTTEQCLLNPNRNPRADARRDRGSGCATASASSASSGSAHGLVEDDDTDGHVDNVAAFIAAGRVLLQTLPDAATRTTSDWPRTARARCSAAGLEVVELRRCCPTPTVDGERSCSYLNLYLVQRRAWSCRVAADADTTRDALDAHRARATPAARSSACRALVLAYGGGGVHCITQQVPRRRRVDRDRRHAADHRRRAVPTSPARVEARAARAVARRRGAAPLASRPGRAPRRARRGRARSPPARARGSSACRS